MDFPLPVFLYAYRDDSYFVFTLSLGARQYVGITHALRSTLFDHYYLLDKGRHPVKHFQADALMMGTEQVINRVVARGSLSGMLSVAKAVMLMDPYDYNKNDVVTCFLFGELM